MTQIGPKGRCIISQHADCLMAQRNLRPEDVSYILLHARDIHRTGVIICFLAHRDIPREDLADASKARLEGSVVILDKEGNIITAYRNRRAYKHIRRKAKYYRPAA